MIPKESLIAEGEEYARPKNDGSDGLEWLPLDTRSARAIAALGPKTVINRDHGDQ